MSSTKRFRNTRLSKPTPKSRRRQLLFESLENRRLLTASFDCSIKDVWVTTRDGNGDNTLASAIEKTNHCGNLGYTGYSIQTSLTTSLRPSDPLPIITEPVVINGLVIDGSLVNDPNNAQPHGLRIQSDNVELVGITVFNYNDGAGVVFENTANSSITDSTIGSPTPDSNFSSSEWNAVGILLQNSSNIRVIDSLIANNHGYGIKALNSVDSLVSGSTVINNWQQGIGVEEGSHRMSIRDSIIDNNFWSGIYVNSSDYATITQNQIGKASAATETGNRAFGVELYNSDHADIDGNTISGNRWSGLALRENSQHNDVTNNKVGTNATGTSAIGNSHGGIIVNNSSNNTLHNNTVSGNGWSGIYVQDGATSNQLIANRVGTNNAGNAALTNSNYGIVVERANTNQFIGNTVSGNTWSGFWINDADYNRITANYVGFGFGSNTKIPNNAHGIELVNGSSYNLIGADRQQYDDDQPGNYVSANGLDGVHIASGSNNNLVAANTIGTNLSGVTSLSNSSQKNGVAIYSGAWGNTIGAPISTENTSAYRNTISGNLENGVVLAGDSTSLNTISGNYIGVSYLGNAAIANGHRGVAIWNESNRNTIANNVLSGNTWDGLIITVGSYENHAYGNKIGTSADGTVAIPNDVGIQIAVGSHHNIIGVNSDGIADAIEGNLVSGNRWDGIMMNSDSHSNTVAGNRVGTDVTGTLAIANASSGISVWGNSTTNRIGTDGNGVSDAIEANLVSGNIGTGIYLRDTTNNQISGNIVGLDSTGTAKIPNQQVGIRFDGETNNHLVGVDISTSNPSSMANIISGNGWSGIATVNNNNSNLTIVGNIIGTNAALATEIGNSQHGIHIFGVEPSNLTIGGSSPDPGNTIANNVGNGVYMQFENSPTTTFTENRVFGNGNLGIDLGAYGPNLNLADESDGIRNTPFILSAALTPQSLILTGLSDPGMVFDLYLTESPANTWAQGKTFMLRLTEGSDGEESPQDSSSNSGLSYQDSLGNDDSGLNMFRFVLPRNSLPAAINESTLFAALAIGPLSEFSPSRQAILSTPQIQISANTVNEDLSVGSIVAQFSGIYSDASSPSSMSFAFISGEGDTDNSSFTIEGNNLLLNSNLDYSQRPDLSIRIRATDEHNRNFDAAFSIHVNAAPTDILLSNESINENTATNTVVGIFTSVDPDTTGPFTYTLVSGNGDSDNSVFNIDGDQLKITESPNYEAKSSYSIRIQTTDPDGCTYSEVFTINVTDINENPTDILLSKTYVYDNIVPNSTTALVSVIDPDTADSFEITLVEGDGDTHNGLFDVVDHRLIAISDLSVFPNNTPLSIRLKGADTLGLSVEKAFSITVREADFTNFFLETVTIDENMDAGTEVSGFAVIGADISAATFMLTENNNRPDNQYFSIENKKLIADVPFDLESRSYYQIELKATVGEIDIIRGFTIYINPVNEFAPELSSETSFSVDEEELVIATLTTTDQDVQPSTPTLTLSGGDSELFEIINNELRFKVAPDFEYPQDADQDNIYQFNVIVTEDSLSTQASVSVTVGDINDIPTAVTMTYAADPEQAFPDDLPIGGLVGTLSVTDADGPGTPSFQLVDFGGPTDNSSFEIIGNAIHSLRTFDYRIEADRELVIQVVATDGLGAESIPTRITLTLSEQPKPPTPVAQDIVVDRNSTLDVLLSANGSGGEISYVVTQDPSYGTITGTLPNLTYTPGENYVGSDIFYFTATEAGLTSFEAAVRITVNGVTPTVTLSGGGSFAEGDRNIPITVSLSEPADIDLTIAVEIDDASSATLSEDYLLPVTQVTIPQGETEGTIEIILSDDNSYEEDETVLLNLTPSVLFTDGNSALLEIQITNDDAEPTIFVPESPVRFNETDPQILIPFRLSALSYLPVTLPFTLSGTTDADSDYVALGETSFTIPAGQLTGTLSIDLINDSDIEDFESLIVSFTEPSVGTYEDNALAFTFTANIVDDDMPAVSMQTPLALFSEADGIVDLVANLSRPGDDWIYVPVALSGTASGDEQDADYAFVDGSTFVFPPGETTASLPLRILDDSNVETQYESLYVELQTTGSGTYRLDDDSSGYYTIEDNDKVLAQFSSGAITAWENDGTVAVTIQIDRVADVDITIPVIASGAGIGWMSASEFTLASNSVVIPAGSSEGTLSLVLIDDGSNESTEKIRLSFGESNTHSFEPGTQSSTVVYVRDNDPLLEGVVSTLPRVAENTSSAAKFQFYLSDATNEPITIPFTLSGSARAGLDYVAPETYSVTIPALQQSAIVSVPIKADSLAEGDEIITINAGSVSGRSWRSGAPRVSSTTIVDDDRVTVQFTKTTQSVSEQGIRGWGWIRRDRTVTAEIQLSAPAARDVDVTLNFSGTAKLGTDYYFDNTWWVSRQNGYQVRIPAGTISKSISFRITQDTLYEGNESIVVMLTGSSPLVSLPSSSLRKQTITILDDDKPPTPPAPARVTPDQYPPGALRIPIPPSTPQTGSYPTNQAILNAIPRSNSNTSSTGLPSTFIHPPGALSIDLSTANGGVLEGATAFFDANFNGIVDYSDELVDGETIPVLEPSMETQADGSFSLMLQDFDSNGNGVIDFDEGRYIITGGTDLSIGLELPLPMLAPVGVYKINPLSTIVESLIRTEEFTAENAYSRVASAFRSADYDFIAGNPLYETIDGDVAAADAYKRMVESYSAILLISQYLSGASNRELLPIGLAANDALAFNLSEPDSVALFEEPEFLKLILKKVASEHVIDLDETQMASVVDVIAEGLAHIEAINRSDYDSGEDFLLALYKAKNVNQIALANAVYDVGRGTKTVEELSNEYTGTALDELIDNASSEVTVPPVVSIGSSSLYEGENGTQVMRLAVVASENRSYPISVDYQTASATAESGTDFVDKTGTLTWNPEDESVQYVEITINGDTEFETDEYFQVLLSNPNRVAVRTAEGYGFVINDDEIELDYSNENGAEVAIESTAAELELTRNSDILISGDFTQSVTLQYLGSENYADTFRYTTIGNALRDDAIQLIGGASDDDSFILESGILDVMEVSFSITGDNVVRLFGDGSMDAHQVTLSDIEEVSLVATESDAVFLRVPYAYESLTLKSVEGDTALVQGEFGNGYGLTKFYFTKPTQVTVLGIGDIVTIDNQVDGLDVVAYRAGLYLANPEVDENSEAPTLGEVLTYEYGFGTDTRYEILTPFDDAIGEFAIVDTNKLKITGSIDHESTPVLRTKIRATSVDGAIIDEVIEILVNDLPESPTEIQLSSTSISENLGVSVLVANITTSDPDDGDTHTYILTSGQGADDNDAFSIDGATLKTNADFDFESKSSYSIRIRSTDSTARAIEQQFTISVIDVPEMVADPIFGDGTSQRSLIKQIVLTFDKEVVFAEGAVSLSKRGEENGGVTVTVGAASDDDNGQKEYAVTFSGEFTRGDFNALVDGYYELTIDGSKITRDGKQLDINGDGQLGGTITFGDKEADKFFARYADTNGDGVIGIADFAKFRRTYGKLSNDPGYDEIMDFDGDGAVGYADFIEFRNRFGKPRMEF